MDQGWAPLAGKQRPESGAVHSWTGLSFKRWGRHRESNWGMSDLQSDALPAWLWRHRSRATRSRPFRSRQPAGGGSLLRWLPRAWDDQSAREAPQHPAQLAPLVAQVRVLAALVGQGRLAVDELQLDHAEGDSPVAHVHRALRQPHGKLGDEIEHLVGVAGKFVLLRLLLLVQQ